MQVVLRRFPVHAEIRPIADIDRGCDRSDAGEQRVTLGVGQRKLGGEVVLEFRIAHPVCELVDLRIGLVKFPQHDELAVGAVDDAGDIFGEDARNVRALPLGPLQRVFVFLIGEEERPAPNDADHHHAEVRGGLRPGVQPCEIEATH